MTATFTCPECGEPTEMVTKNASGFACTCNKCEHQWMSTDKGENLETPTEPDGRAHSLRLGQRSGHVAILASKSTREALGRLMETPGDTTSWAMGIRKKPMAYDAIQRDSTELGPTVPAAKSQVSNYSAIRRPSRISQLRKLQKHGVALGTDDTHAVDSDRFDRFTMSKSLNPRTFDFSGPVKHHSVESQARELVSRVLERQKHTCGRCKGEGEVEVEGEGKVTCPSCMGSGQVRRRQNQRSEAVDDRAAHHDLWDRAVEVAEQAGEVSGAMMLINFLAEVYNGGVSQYIYNGYSNEYEMVMRYLGTLKNPAASALANKMAAMEQSFHEAIQADKESADAQRRGDEFNENPMDEYENDFGILEDFIYNDANIDPILTAMVGSAAPATTVVQPQNSQTRTEAAEPYDAAFALRPMSDEERMGFQGVDDGPNGEPPLVGGVTFGGGYEGLVIVDRNSVQVHFDSPGGDGYEHHAFMFQTPYAQGKGIAQQVMRMTDLNQLLELGFQEI